MRWATRRTPSHCGVARIIRYIWWLTICALALLTFAPSIGLAQEQAPTTRAVISSESLAQARIRAAEKPEKALSVSQPGGKRIALVIGNANYQRILKLANPLNDANDVCSGLRSLQFDTICLLDIHSRRELREAVRAFAGKLDSRSIAFFYYAGHGVQLNGENYLLPIGIDARSTADIEEDGLSLSYVLRSLEDVRSSPNIVVLDACRENPFPKLTTGGAAKGLARVEPPVGTMLVYATAPNGVALDGSGRNGLFTKHFVRHLADPGLKIDELFQVVAEAVEGEARLLKMEQVPYRSSSYSGAYCLAGCENAQVARELAQIEQQRAEAASRIAALLEENAVLKRQADARNHKVFELESRISALSRDASTAGAENSSVREEMSRLKAALSLAKSEQAKAEAQKEVSAKKETEVSMLKEQLAGLQEKTRQIDAYRDQFASLQKQSEDAARRMQSLMDENRRLKLLADEKSSNVSALESRIEKLTKDAHVSGKDSMKEQQELARLQAALDAARTEQKAAEKMKSVVSGRELEIVQLKEQLADLQKQAHQLEEYRKQVLALQKESAEKSRLLDEKDGAVRSRKPVMVPSF